MTVIVLTACPPGVRGDLCKWLLEIAPGIFVGRISARIREKLWARIKDMERSGRAIMVYPKRCEQHFGFEVFQPDWEVVDCEGVELIRRPIGTDDATLFGQPKKGWSKASKYRQARKYASRQRD